MASSRGPSRRVKNGSTVHMTAMVTDYSYRGIDTGLPQMYRTAIQTAINVPRVSLTTAQEPLAR